VNRLTYIKWLDACSEPTIEWTDMSACEFTLQEVESVGWVVSDEEDHVALAQNIHQDGPEDDDPRIAGVIVIPKVNIISRVRVEPLEVYSVGEEAGPPAVCDPSAVDRVAVRPNLGWGSRT